MNLLVIDSDKETADLLCEYLQDSGHQCLAVNNGRNALEALNKNQYDVTFLELDMPELSGYGIIDELARTGKIDKQNIIILTACDKISDTQISELKNKGVRSYFRKPLDIDFLANVLDAGLKFEKHNE
ncbi:MAG TPA: response regulator [Candidatus Nitrosotalea sp.]|nr:response regulator [Candidatus Nitrosotalea sp.]